jgi:hypothetical protein
MPQEQRIVTLQFLNNDKGSAVATGNNAAWLCVCPRTVPLVGRSGKINGPSDGMRIECPDCRRSYFVFPDGRDYNRVLRVEEIQWNK